MGLFDKLFKKKEEPMSMARKIRLELEEEERVLVEKYKESIGTENFESATHELMLFIVEDILRNYEKACGDVDSYYKSVKKYLDDKKDEDYLDFSFDKFNIPLIRFDRNAIIEGIRGAWDGVETILRFNEIPGLNLDYKELIKEYRANPHKDLHEEVRSLSLERNPDYDYPLLTDELIDRFNFIVDHFVASARHNGLETYEPFDSNLFLYKFDGTRFEIDYIGSGKPLEETVDAAFPYEYNGQKYNS